MRVNIYIRKEDEDKWKALPNKAEWLSYHLNNPVEYTYRLQATKDNESYVSLAIPTQKNTGLPKGNEGFVEAGVNKEKLNVLVPGCCKQVKPCKHWQWNGLEQAYINTITGERKEVQ